MRREKRETARHHTQPCTDDKQNRASGRRLASWPKPSTRRRPYGGATRGRAATVPLGRSRAHGSAS
eukprot:10745774-Alexandrium_andersonii.AAC.1